MQKNSSLTGWRILVNVLTFILIVTADQLSKTWIRTFPLDSQIGSWSFLRIIYIRNPGSAFGLFQGQATPLKIIAIVSMCVFLALAIFVYKRYPYLLTKWNTIAFGLIIGGTAGNLIDRLRFGQVTDFVDPGFWPVFNVADSAVSVGAVMIAISLLGFAIKENNRNPKT